MYCIHSEQVQTTLYKVFNTLKQTPSV